MFKTLRGRIITIILAIGIAGWQIYDKHLKLGLDLQGGMYLVLEVADPDETLTDEARAAAIETAERVVRSRIDELGVEEPVVQRVGSDRLIVELAGVTDAEQAREIVSQAAFLQFKLVLPVNDVRQALPRVDRAIVATLGADEVRRLGAEAVAEAPAGEVEALLFGGGDSTSAQGAEAEQAADSAPATERVTELRPLTGLLNTGDFEGTFLVETESVDLVQRFLDMPEVQRGLPRNTQLHWGEDVVARGARTYRRLYVLEEDPFMRGDELEDAVAGRDPQFNQAQVQFELTRRGGRDFARFTSQHVGDYLAILLDDDVISAPVIRDRIGARGQIDLGNSPMEEAHDLALVLRAGALPAPLEIIEERTVGPSLGQDSIDQGELAGVIGLTLVLVIMLGYYRVAGFLAVLALGIYVLLVLGGLAGLGANLTLPGLAGLILSVGMAVDANVLIFERIREELAAGRATRTAVDEGFANALSAIVDANITTLITALILFNFGTGPVQGFAVTLSIGIVASFFSALFVTRTFFLIYLSGKKASDAIQI